MGATVESSPPAPQLDVGWGQASKGPGAQTKVLLFFGRMELSPDLISACLALEKYLGNPNALTERELVESGLHHSAARVAGAGLHPELVRRHLVTFRAMSARLLDYVVNIADSNGNTALHYSVSHANFPVVRQLLDSGVCQVDKQNRAGYSPIMLTALATLKTQDDIETVIQLFRLGDVNAKASQAGQTALMLAVSHGRVDVVKALLTCEADVNVQDDDGSTALMCACEHGHKEIAGLLLAVPSCDISLTDRDGSTALMVALDAGQSEIASMLYSRMNIKCSVRNKAVRGMARDEGSYFRSQQRGDILGLGLWLSGRLACMRHWV
uniref:KN motif and ankyrin repeat domain-containing protein 2 n=1 Tax=Spermophilus dauricus TaxID=99837 RepID=A0A8C9UMA0_SPEDA